MACAMHRYGHPLGRSGFLAGTAAAATGLALPLAAFAQSPPAARRIDVHNHLVPPPFLAAGRPEIIAGADVDPAPILTWSPEKALAEMDRTGVQSALLSMGTPAVSVLASLGHDRDRIRATTRACNEYAASLAARYPGRFGSFAAMPLPDVPGSLNELAYALDTLKADGIGIFTSYGDVYPGDPSFEPFFAELNRRKAVVFVHPTSPACCANSLPGISATLDEFMFEVTRAITSMLFGGVFTKHPDIRFIFTHAGGTVMPISGRIAAFAARHHEYDADVPGGAIPALKKLYYDIANSTNPSAMAALMDLIPSSQILFGSDTPYVPLAVTAGAFDKMAVPDDVRAAIDRGNALRLFPRFA